MVPLTLELFPRFFIPECLNDSYDVLSPQNVDGLVVIPPCNGPLFFFVPTVSWPTIFACSDPLRTISHGSFSFWVGNSHSRRPEPRSILAECTPRFSFWELLRGNFNYRRNPYTITLHVLYPRLSPKTLPIRLSVRLTITLFLFCGLQLELAPLHNWCFVP